MLPGSEICVVESLLLMPENFKFADREIYIHCGFLPWWLILKLFMQRSKLFCSFSEIMPVACLTRLNFTLKIQLLFLSFYFLSCHYCYTEGDESMLCRTLERVITRSWDSKFHKQNLTGLYFSRQAANAS